MSTSPQQQQVVTNKDSNTNVITDYLQAMQTETNPSATYTNLTKWILTKLSRFHKDKPFTSYKRNDIIAFLNSFRKSDDQDPMHKWVGTYNLHLICVTRFFKWLYHPDISPGNRPKPEVVENILQIKRKE